MKKEVGTIEGLYGWLRNITCYILFMSILDNLLPGKKYGKYLKLFAGMVLILLVVQPFTGSLRLEDKIAHYYESFVFRYQADDLRQELLGVEEQRLEQMILQYEEAVGQDLTMMAEDSGLTVLACRAAIGREQETERFGMVQSVSMKVALAGEPLGAAVVDSTDITISPIEKIGPSGSHTDETETGIPHAEERKRQEEERAAVARLRRKIASYYNLEEAYVEIQIVEGQG